VKRLWNEAMPFLISTGVIRLSSNGALFLRNLVSFTSANLMHHKDSKMIMQS